MLIALVLLPAVGLLSCALTGWFRRYAIRQELLDVPNARSSHTVATPRGGGAAIVAATLAGHAALWLAGGIGSREFVALQGSGLAVAAIGFADDRRTLAAHWRLLAHFAAAAWVIACLGALPVRELAGLSPAWLAIGLTAIHLVWMLNLTNFMDGIDGLAAVEALTVCAGVVLLTFLRPDYAAHRMPVAVLAAAVLGFLVWNWPPARIFMGDAGSGFLGLVLAALSVVAARIDPPLFWCWTLLLGVFIVDATVTLARRLLAGERVHVAHRTHAYQHAAGRYGHRAVTLTVGAINLLWLLPLGALISAGLIDGRVGLLVGYTPLAAAALALQAGKAVSSPVPASRPA